MLATKPADMAGSQMKMNKQAETHMAHNAAVISRDAESDQARTIRASEAEGQKIGTEEREKGNGSGGKRKGKDEKEKREEWVDPMLSLPVEKGKYAKPQKHFINIEV
jgi:hypothetical protein